MKCKGLPSFLNADFVTVRSDLTTAAKWGDRFADELPVRNQDVVVGDPIPLGKFLPQGGLALFGGFGLNITDPV